MRYQDCCRLFQWLVGLAHDQLSGLVPSPSDRDPCLAGRGRGRHCPCSCIHDLPQGSCSSGVNCGPRAGYHSKPLSYCLGGEVSDSLGIVSGGICVFSLCEVNLSKVIVGQGSISHIAWVWFAELLQVLQVLSGIGISFQLNVDQAQAKLNTNDSVCVFRVLNMRENLDHLGGILCMQTFSCN